LIDIHHHILPGLDDGPATPEEALAMARRAAANGIDTIVATPHMLEGVYHVTAAQVRDAVAALNRALNAGPPADRPPRPVTILPGADVHLHEDLLVKLKRGEVLTINDTGVYLLLELPPTVLPSRMGPFLFEIQSAGIRPILTHPERHPRILERPAELPAWVTGGGLVQVTAASYLGRFGTEAREAAERWTGEGRVHVIATDAHPMPGREPLLAEAAARLETLAGRAEADRLARTNPERIIRGMPLHL
jgi:protein-tyrosine phosphatase